jgi:glutaredoxin
MVHVKGKNKGRIKLYTLSTCIWCKKTKALLKEIGVEYAYEDVDLLDGEDEEKVNLEMEKYTSNPSFPLIIVDDKYFTTGFDEDKIKKRFAI